MTENADNGDAFALLDLEQVALALNCGRHRLDARHRRGGLPAPCFVHGRRGSPLWRPERLPELAAAINVPVPRGGWAVCVVPLLHQGGGPSVHVLPQPA